MNPIKKFFTRKKETSIPSDLLKLFTSGGDTITRNDPTAFAAVHLIASSFAGLSGKFYSKVDKREIKDYPLYEALENPNLEDTKFQFFYQSVKDYFDGNVFWYKVYGGDGTLLSLFRLDPSNVRVRRDAATNRKIYTAKGIDYDSDTIVHIPSVYGFNGLVGKSLFTECNKVFSTSQEIDEFIKNSFNNSIGNRLVIDLRKSYPNITKEELENFKQMFSDEYTTVKNASKPLIKSRDIDYTTIETDFKDNRATQLVENRTFQEKEISKLFGVPLSLLTGREAGNIESIFIIFIETAILPVATQFEQTINRMIPIEDRSRVYFEYSYNSLQKVSLTTRIDAYLKQVTNAMITPNEIRRKENMPEVDPAVGELLYIGANLLPMRKDVIDAYMANSKVKMEELQNKENQHEKIGDDKQ